LKNFIKKKLIIILLLIGCDSQSSIEILEKSKDLINEQKYSEAIDELNYLIDKFPKSNEAAKSQYLIADTYAFLNNYKDAIDGYRLVVSQYSATQFAINGQFMLGYIYANFLFDYNLFQFEF